MPSSDEISFTGRQVTLGCDEGGVGLSAPILNPTGVTVEGVSPARQAQGSGADFDLSGAVGSFAFLKSPVYLNAGVHRATISVPDDDLHALAWVPLSVWAGGTSMPDIRPWLATEVILIGCPGAVVGFLGGILAADKDTCFPLTVKIGTGPPTTTQMRMNGRACPER